MKKILSVAFCALMLGFALSGSTALAGPPENDSVTPPPNTTDGTIIVYGPPEND